MILSSKFYKKRNYVYKTLKFISTKFQAKSSIAINAKITKASKKTIAKIKKITIILMNSILILYLFFIYYAISIIFQINVRIKTLFAIIFSVNEKIIKSKILFNLKNRNKK